MRSPRLFLLLQALLTLGFPQAAWAVAVPTVPGWMGSACLVLPGLPCVTGGAAGLSNFVGGVVVPALQIIFLAIAMLFFFYYSFRLIMESDDENTVTETKSAYGYAITGAALVSLAGFFAQAFGVGAQATIINQQPVVDALDLVVRYMRLMVSAAVSLLIVYQGMRIILLQGQESEIEQQKKRFFHGLLGVAIVLLANVVVSAFFPQNNGTQILNTEFVGVINFLLEILGALALLAIIVGGIFLVVSTNDELKDRAKKSIFTAVVSLIIVLSSFLIVNFVAFV